MGLRRHDGYVSIQHIRETTRGDCDTGKYEIAAEPQHATKSFDFDFDFFFFFVTEDLMVKMFGGGEDLYYG